MTAPAERAFVLYARGEIRDEILTSFRVGLRSMTNPSTGTSFTETEIATATAPRSRYYIEADAIDLVLMAKQANALWLADQVRIDRASSTWLTGFHGAQWEEEKLAATGGSGTATATGVAGCTYVGSTTVPDPAATYGTDPSGLRYQVLTTATIAAGQTTCSVTLVGIDTGDVTNIASGTTITWVNPPLNSATTAVTTSAFTGGLDDETDADFADRLAARIRHKPAAGNPAHFRSWARASTNTVEDAYVYPCAEHAGSVHVAITQKRGSTVGPYARIPNTATLTTATSYLTSPGSPVVPRRAHVVVTGVTAVDVSMLVQLALPNGSSSGWADVHPWPPYASGGTTITVYTDSTHFRMTATADPTSGETPSLMWWNATTSRWVQLDVSSVSIVGGGLYDVVLGTAQVMAVGDYICPYTARKTLIAETIEAYFDELGPGELIDLDNDVRGHRAYRFPEPNEEAAFTAGSLVVSRITDALTNVNGTLGTLSPSTPGLPTEVADGPKMLCIKKAAIYPLT